jgi:cytochrome c peroxidase
VQLTFMHNGAFTRLDDAIRHHLNVMDSASHYTPASQNLPDDLRGPLGPMAPVLARLDPALSTPLVLTESQFDQLLAFVRDGLLDPRATPHRLQRLVPHSLPSGRPMLVFKFP